MWYGMSLDSVTENSRGDAESHQATQPRLCMVNQSALEWSEEGVHFRLE